MPLVGKLKSGFAVNWTAVQRILIFWPSDEMVTAAVAVIICLRNILSSEIQPLLLTVTTYLPVESEVIVGVIAPVFHKYDVAGDEVPLN